MSAKYTREQVVTGRLCGLKTFDLAVAAVGMKALLERAVEIGFALPSAKAGTWEHADWAFGNAWREVCMARNLVKPGTTPSSTANLDEMLSAEELEWLADQFKLNVADYAPEWKRRKPTEAEVHANIDKLVDAQKSDAFKYGDTVYAFVKKNAKFLVEVANGTSSYTLERGFGPTPREAIAFYDGIVVSGSKKKRLTMISAGKRTVVARHPK